MTTIFAPALTIRYKEHEDAVVVKTHGMDGVAHLGKPREMRHANLPVLFFQLIDQGYTLQPGLNNGREGYKEVLAFSLEFTALVRASQVMASEEQAE